MPRKGPNNCATEAFSVEVRRGADGKHLLVLASGAPPKTEQIADNRDEMDALAAELNGEYDGWELSVEPTRSASGVRGSVN